MAGNKLYVGNLNHYVTDQALNELFSEHGTVKEIKLFKEKGFGFIEMSTQEEAERARGALDNKDYEGRPLKVDMARPPQKKRRTQFRRY